MLLGAALILVGSAVLYYAVTGKDPRKILSSAAPTRAATRPSRPTGQQR